MKRVTYCLQVPNLYLHDETLLHVKRYSDAPKSKRYNTSNRYNPKLNNRFYPIGFVGLLAQTKNLQALILASKTLNMSNNILPDLYLMTRILEKQIIGFKLAVRII